MGRISRKIEADAVSWAWSTADLIAYKQTKDEYNTVTSKPEVQDILEDFQAAIYSPSEMKKLKKKHANLDQVLTTFNVNAKPMVDKLMEIQSNIASTAVSETCL